MIEGEFYDGYYAQGEHRAVSRSRLRRLLETLRLTRQDAALQALEEGDALLDVGCGEGTLLIAACERYKGLTGIELATSRLQRARRNLSSLSAPRHMLFQTNANRGLPFADETFDAVTCLAVLEHLFDPYFALEEFTRVLKPGGLLIIEVPNVAYFLQRIRLLLGKLQTTHPAHEDYGWDGGHLHYFTVETLTGLFQRFNYTVESVRGCGAFGSLRGLYPALLTADILIKGRRNF